VTEVINGFAIEPSTSNLYLFRRMMQPRHLYVFEVTSKRISLRATFPYYTGVDRAGAFDDAKRAERDAQKAAEEFQRRTFG
jgi:hypothetical protein